MSIDRRRFVLGALALGTVLHTGAHSGAAMHAYLVRTRNGILEGAVADDILVLKGVPYAQPPTGELRFRPPQALSSWSGVRPAIEFGNAPVQAPAPGAMPDVAFFGAPRGEDCLYLNIWAPMAPGPHPVLVFIHGGGNEAGSASHAMLDGASFARQGIVCVTVGYRIGALGFLELGNVLGPAFRGSGNNGLRDIAAALAWVQDNIEEVGGDPDRVTLSGQSAGAKNVCSLLAASATRGDFRSAIVQSGAETTHDSDAAIAVAQTAAAILAESGGTAMDFLSMSPEAIVAMQAALRGRFDRPYPYRGVIDGEFLEQGPLAAIAKGAAREVRLMIGTTRDESVGFLNEGLIGAPLSQSELTNMAVDDASSVFARYARAYPALSPRELRIKFLTAEEYWLSSMRIARAHHAAANGCDTYVYRFDREPAEGPFAGWAAHGMEMPYVWTALDNPLAKMILGAPDVADVTLAAEMQTRWTAFVSGRAPDLPDEPRWPCFGKQENIMVFDEAGQPGRLDTAQLALWDPAS